MFGFGLGFNKEKSRANAERYLQQNKLQNAISEYEKILKVEPRDFGILNQVGDIYSRLGQNGKAIERFRAVGDTYAADGLNLKAIAMYKKITKLDPNDLQSVEKLAGLYRKQGLVADARAMLLQAAEAYTRRNQSKETLRLLKQLVLFDPENVQVISRTADLMTQSGQKNEAKEMLTQTASTLVERRSLEPAQKILDRLIALDRGNLRAQELRAQVTFALGDSEKAAELYEAIPDLDSRVEGLRNLLSAWLKLGKLDNAYPIGRKLVSVHHDADGMLQIAAALYKENEVLRALAIYHEFAAELLAHDKEDVLSHLHGAISRVRTDPDALQTIYRLFQRAGESSMYAEVLELLAHACVQSELFERARDAYKDLIELEPENTAHLQAYRQLCARIAPGSPPPAQGDASPEDKLGSLQSFLTGHEPELPAQSYPEPVEEIVTAALNEAELYHSYSSKLRSITVLEAALQSAPDDLRLNRALGLLYQQEGDAEKSASCCNTIQRVLQTLGAGEAADSSTPITSSAQTTTTWEAKGSEFTASDFNIAPEEALGGTEEIDLSGEWESIWEESPAAESSAPASANGGPAVGPYPTSPAGNISELLEEVRFCLAQQIWDEAAAALARLAQLCPTHPELPALRAQLPAESASPQAHVTEFPLSPAPAEPSLASLAAELDSELGDSFAPSPSSERLPHTRPPLANVGKPAPASGAPAPDRVAHICPPLANVGSPVPAPAPPERMPYMAAAAEPQPDPAPVLAPNVFGDLLQEFERDLAEPQNEDNDPETHFSLGLAFRDMGLLDEAIGELQKVCRLAGNGLSPARTQQAYIWLATCFVEKSVPEASFNWFLRALDTAPDEESRTAVTYELASAYEAAGRKREALDRFLEVYGSNIDYRDVASRIRELRAAL